VDYFLHACVRVCVSRVREHVCACYYTSDVLNATSKLKLGKSDGGYLNSDHFCRHLIFCMYIFHSSSQVLLCIAMFLMNIV